MTLQLQPLQPFAAEASGIDLRQALDATQVQQIEQAMDSHAVLVFRRQPLDEDQQIAFARALGPLDLGLRKLKGGPRRFPHAELADISNAKIDGAVAERDHAKIVGNVANQLWHSDRSFQRPRAKYSMLSAAVVPAEGGETEFADLRQAYDSLPPRLRTQIAGLRAVHRAQHSRFMLGDTQYTEAQQTAIAPAIWPLGAWAAEGRRLQRARNRPIAVLPRAPIGTTMGFSVSPRYTGFRAFHFDAFCRPRS